NSMEHGNWLDIIARSALDVFNLGTDDVQDLIPYLQNSHQNHTSPAPGKSPRSGKKGSQQQNNNSSNNNLDITVVKTPPSISGNVAAAAGNNSGNNNSSFAGVNIGENKSGPSGDFLSDPNSYGWTPTAAWLLAPLVTKLS